MKQLTGYGTTAGEVHSYRGRAWTDPLFSPPSLIDQLRESVSAHRGLPAVSEVTARGQLIRALTYGQLWTEIEAKAKRVPRQRAGIERTVAVLTDNSIAALTTILGVMLGGAAAVVIDASEPIIRRTEMITALGAPLVTSNGDTMETAAIGEKVESAPKLAITPWPTAIVMFTTGSTAASKAVAQSGYSVAVNARAVGRHLGLAPGISLACPLPISHVNGLELGMFACLLAGAHVILLKAFDPLHFTEALAVTGADLATTVPSILTATASLHHGPSTPRLRYFVSAAAPLHPRTAQDVMTKLGKRVVQGYGLSECMNFATMMPVDLPDEEYARLMLDADTPPVGHAIDGCEVAIADDNSAQSALGAVGEVCVRGHSVMTGYINNPDASAAALHAGWLRTGDLGYLAPGPGTMPLLTITGRLKHIAKCGGLSVSLEEVERAIRRLRQIRDVCCVSRPHTTLGEALTVYVVVDPEAAGDIISDIRCVVRDIVDPQRAALRIKSVGALPTLRSGKIDRVTLQERSCD